jgi:putative glycosyl hydrolase-like family 6 (GHL6) protein
MRKLTPTRRQFLRSSTLATAALLTSSVPASSQSTSPPAPWYRRTYRWGQTNITEADVDRYDLPWWRSYWKRTATQGVIVNAGGIFAYYPSKFPLHHRATGLNDRDLYGQIASAAHEDGLVVLARMDSSKAHADFYQAHPDYFAKDQNGRPYRSGDLYIACINSPYYSSYLPDVLREIIDRSHPEGFTDNSWAGLDRGSICYCDNCNKRFKDATGKSLPRSHNWDDPPYRQWIEWSYARRVETWDAFNKVTREAGGPDCLWLGMNSGSVTAEARSFRDLRAVCRRSQILMLDHQSRPDNAGFADNAFVGKLLHGVLGPDKLIPESMPMYQAGRATFRLTAKPAVEARMWMLAGFAGGIQPWWHHISAYHEDRRAYHTAEPVMQWHRQNEQYLVNRTPAATVGVVWSQRNTDFFGRDNPEELVDQPLRGFIQALVRARIPFIPVHIDDVPKHTGALATLVLPNVGAMFEDQVIAIRDFVSKGGGLVATGQTSLFDQWGEDRPDFALADLFGVTGGKGARRSTGPSRHSYLRLFPELRAEVDGPHVPNEPRPEGRRHEVLKGLDETDILAFGGVLSDLKVARGAQVLATFVPAFPAFPPEISWMREPKTDIPALVLNETPGSRVAFLPADLDRRYALDNLPDHANLLANLVRWTARENIPVEVTGHGLIDCELYTQPGRTVLHLLNLTNTAAWRSPAEELTPVGPLRIRVRLPRGNSARTVKLLVSGKSAQPVSDGQWASVDLESITDHEVLAFE